MADCVPALLADPDAGVVAAAHAGRTGAAAGVLPTAIAAMEELGAERSRVEVLLGPAVCGACYEVPAEMRDEVEAALPGSAASTRLGTSTAELACRVAQPPSWPVFIAASMSTTSAPRTSPTPSRSGRIRSA